MLGQIPGVFAPPSTHILSDLHPILSYYSPLNESNFRRLAEDVVRLIEANILEWVGGPPGVGQILDVCNGMSLEHLFCAALDAAAVQRGLTKWLSKDLDNVHFLRDLERVIPNLKVIHLVRDPRDVALSFSSAPIGPKDPRAIALAWVDDQNAALRYRASIAEGKQIEIHYEDLVLQTEGVMRRLCEHFGLSYSPSVNQFYLTSDAVTAGKMSSLWEKLALPVTIDSVGKWLDREHRSFVELVEGGCYDLLISMGYEPLYARCQLHYTDRQLCAIRDNDEAMKASKPVIRTKRVLERRNHRLAILTDLRMRAHE